MAKGECPACNTPNEYSETHCSACGQMLPRASSLGTMSSRPSGSTGRGPVAANTPTLPPSARNWIVGAIIALVLVISAAAFVNRRNEMHRTVEHAFDIPPLIGKNIDQVRATLGKPYEDFPEKVWPGGDDENGKTWRRGKKRLYITFHSQTRRIVDFFIECDDPSGACSDKQKLLDLGNIKDSGPNYTTEFVNAGAMRDKYTGVKVIPK